MKKWFLFNWLKLMAIGLALGALYPFPYAYFQLMNWVVAGAALITAFQAKEQGRASLMWLFILVAVIFNPITPFYLRADIWQIADLTVSLLFVVSLLIVRPRS